jgi:hypothetical protein
MNFEQNQTPSNQCIRSYDGNIHTDHVSSLGCHNRSPRKSSARKAKISSLSCTTTLQNLDLDDCDLSRKNVPKSEDTNNSSLFVLDGTDDRDPVLSREDDKKIRDIVGVTKQTPMCYIRPVSLVASLLILLTLSILMTDVWTKQTVNPDAEDDKSRSSFQTTAPDSTLDQNVNSNSTISLVIESTPINETLDTMPTIVPAVTQSFSLDNYYTNPHVVYKDETKYLYKPPILIVGGTDGSGTRAVVDLLRTELGVLMLFEDNSGLDIHASPMFNGQGWPPLVNMILNYTRSANYEVSDLPLDIYKKAMDELRKFKYHYDEVTTGMWYNHDENWKYLLHGGLAGGPAVGTKYGFKAPISMVLLPLLRELYGNIKFVHVIRDGRDVSLSTNKSPVEKFHDSYSGGRDVAEQKRQDALAQIKASNSSIDHRALLAMDLWNDWNVQVHQFAQKHADGGESFDYITLRSEDLLQSTETRFASILKLANFVGSQRSMDDICQFSQTNPIYDMGASELSDITSQGNSSSQEQFVASSYNTDQGFTVKKRYGKWKTRLENEPIISNILHKRGAVALQIFGYEPFQSTHGADFYNMTNDLRNLTSSLCTYSSQTRLDHATNVLT